MKPYEKQFLEIFEEHPEKGVAFLEEYIKTSSDDEEMLSYALFIQSAPYDDYPTAHNVLQSLIAKNPFNARVVITLAYLEFINVGGVSDSTLKLINQCLNQIDIPYKGILFCLKAKYYYYTEKNLNEAIINLKKSIEIDCGDSYNFILLGRLLEDKLLFIKALKNITKVFDEEDYRNYNPLDVDFFINESLRGIWVTKENYEGLQEEINAMCK